jgi:hypothetical protein
MQTAVIGNEARSCSSSRALWLLCPFAASFAFKSTVHYPPIHGAQRPSAHQGHGAFLALLLGGPSVPGRYPDDTPPVVSGWPAYYFPF